MKVIIAHHGCTIQWDGVYYFSLPNYPDITLWDLRNLALFADYEKANGREPVIECADATIRQAVDYALLHPESVMFAERPEALPGHLDCADCKGGRCYTDLLCHTAGIEDAKSIFSSGSILSAAKARNRTCTDLAAEKRNAAGDPPDYFDYAMFAWGNCQAGDRLVMERLLGRSPDPEDFSVGFRPGVRFFFRYDRIARHPNATFDGYHPLKVKDGIDVNEYLSVCVVPENHKSEFLHIVPRALAGRVHYVQNDCPDVCHWSDKAYRLALQNL